VAVNQQRKKKKKKERKKEEAFFDWWLSRRRTLEAKGSVHLNMMYTQKFYFNIFPFSSSMLFFCTPADEFST
jgi:hypothetical protein